MYSWSRRELEEVRAEESHTPYFLEPDDEIEDEYDELGLNFKQEDSSNTQCNTGKENPNQSEEESHQVWKPRLKQRQRQDEDRSTPQAVSHRPRRRGTAREAADQRKEQLRLRMLSGSSHSSEDEFEVEVEEEAEEEFTD